MSSKIFKIEIKWSCLYGIDWDFEKSDFSGILLTFKSSFRGLRIKGDFKMFLHFFLNIDFDLFSSLPVPTYYDVSTWSWNYHIDCKTFLVLNFLCYFILKNVNNISSKNFCYNSKNLNSPLLFSGRRQAGWAHHREAQPSNRQGIQLILYNAVLYNVVWIFLYGIAVIIIIAASVHECFLFSKIIEGLNLSNSLATICLPSDPLLVMLAIMVMVMSNFDWSE